MSLKRPSRSARAWPCAQRAKSRSWRCRRSVVIEVVAGKAESIGASARRRHRRACTSARAGARTAPGGALGSGLRAALTEVRHSLGFADGFAEHFAEKED